MTFILLFALACSPAQLQAAGHRVQGKGPIEQAWILADVGCFDLAHARVDAVLATAQGQHRLHALFTRGRIAARQCETTCTDASRQRGRIALKAVIENARAAGQVEIARAMLTRLRPPEVVVVVPVRSAPTTKVGLQKPAEAVPTLAPVMVAPARSRFSNGLWLGAGGALLGAAASSYWTLQGYKETQRLSAAQSALECDGRRANACRSAWQSSLNRTRWGYGVSLGLGAVGLGLGVAAWWSGRTVVEASPRGMRLRGVW